jgi:hypothetical protein
MFVLPCLLMWVGFWTMQAADSAENAIRSKVEKIRGDQRARLDALEAAEGERGLIASHHEACTLGEREREREAPRGSYGISTVVCVCVACLCCVKLWR